jgi:2-hydroxycyclohexanecarboxyl-CoA dehydrogenase
VKDIAGRVAVVTGGGGGIGSAVCLRLAEEGARVAVADRSEERAQATAEHVRKQGGEATVAVADVADSSAVEGLFTQVENELGLASILVNGVGISEGENVFATDPGQWERTLAVNVGSYFLCARALSNRLRAADASGVIVNISSTNAFYAEPDAIAYTASKGGVEALTKGLALELAAFNIRVNAVCPGIIRTPVTEGMLADSEDAERLLATWENAHALGRLGQPHEIAAVIAFLASGDASFVTGSSWVADGGLSSGWLF